MTGTIEVLTRETKEGRCALLRFAPSLRASFGDDLRRTFRSLLDDGIVHFIFDLTNVSDCESSSLGTFIGFHSTTRRRGGSVRIVLHADSHIAQLVRLLKLDRVVSLLDPDDPQASSKDFKAVLKIDDFLTADSATDETPALSIQERCFSEGTSISVSLLDPARDMGGRQACASLFA